MVGNHNPNLKIRKAMTNNEFISLELDWLTRMIIARIKKYFNQDASEQDIDPATEIPSATAQGCTYEKFIVDNKLTLEDRVYLALTVSTILKPQIMDCFNIRNSSTDQRFVEFGCVSISDEPGLKPTLSTVLFILAGADIEKRITLSRHFLNHPLFSSSLFPRNTKSESINYTLSPSREFIDKILLEVDHCPELSTDFPARRIKTDRTWNDLILDQSTKEQIDDILLWLKHGDTLLNEWELKGRIKNGYRALFYGPSGTGKTFTASLLGKETGKEVYCVDLSLIASKYIGETEKNLSNLFAKAEGRDWILFFDEADALFGKRTNIKDSHDRYANQEIAYLLQRVEDYKGLVVLSTNLKTNIDDAFARRFQSIIRFPMPDAEHREILWKESFSSHCKLAEDIDIKEIASRYEISGGAILNVIQYCSLRSLSKGTEIISKDDLIEGIRREFHKEGKMVD